jgi:hypothetical protein
MKLHPECLGKALNKKYVRGIAYTSEGYLLPCCWLDIPRLKPELERFGLFNEKLRLENNNSVEDIIESDEWQSFMEVVLNDPENAVSQCKRKCGSD